MEVGGWFDSLVVSLLFVTVLLNLCKMEDYSSLNLVLVVLIRY